jgi:outer membrane protein OmpA-like peptidoglycan-associated protein
MRRFGCLLLFALIAACTPAPSGPTHKVVVFFQEWSAALDPAATAAVGAAAQLAKDRPGAQLEVTGFADPKGSGQANDSMSLTRAQVVADQLVADGVNRARIVLSARGATDFTQTSQESRRVEIAIGTP